MLLINVTLLIFLATFDVFLQKELNFSRLLLSQKKLAAGLIAPEDYLHITRQSIGYIIKNDILSIHES
jgi:hypothetical protein